MDRKEKRNRKNEAYQLPEATQLKRGNKWKEVSEKINTQTNRKHVLLEDVGSVLLTHRLCSQIDLSSNSAKSSELTGLHITHQFL